MTKTATGKAAATSSPKALAYVDAHREAFLDDLKAFLRIPSVSTTPERRADVKRAAEWVATQLRQMGMEHVRLIYPIKDGHPLVSADWLHAEGKPTVLLYGHYDVQPAEPLEEWSQPDPFEPVIRNENLYARGAVDDKGQALALLKALESLLRADGALPVNVRVLIEGEEEFGGASIEKYVREHPDEIPCDVVLVADTEMPAPGVPAITYGLRGIIYTEIVAKGAKRDLHSGEFGGIAPNPLHALALVISELKGRDGHIKIPGLYRKVKKINDEEKALWQRAGVDFDSVFKHEMGTKSLPGEAGFSAQERVWARPTLEVHGIVGGYVGEGAKTVIPAEAKAKVSLRLPPELNPSEVLDLLRKRVSALAPEGVTLSVVEVHAGRGVLVPLDNVYMRAAERALEQEWGRKPVFMRTGGSIPVGALFDSELHTPIIFMGTGLPDDNIHAPNEKYHLPHFYKLMRQAIRFLTIAGTDPAVVARPRMGKAAPARRTTTKATVKP
jgi:acetylornithine deacetylase/succinyl-diaminopimelate desuccinylase-like protein